MEKKEFLTEENYEKSKKKIKKIALIILIAGILLGVGLITTGLVLSNNAKNSSPNDEEKVVNTEKLNENVIQIIK